MVLCAAIHEYGPNWDLASEILHGMTGGGYYQGRYRHPAHCCERVRELVQKHVLSINDTTSKDKAVNVGSGKTLLRVTEVLLLENFLISNKSLELNYSPHRFSSFDWLTLTQNGKVAYRFLPRYFGGGR